MEHLTASIVKEARARAHRRYVANEAVTIIGQLRKQAGLGDLATRLGIGMTSGVGKGLSAVGAAKWGGKLQSSAGKMRKAHGLGEEKIREEALRRAKTVVTPNLKTGMTPGGIDMTTRAGRLKAQEAGQATATGYYEPLMKSIGKAQLIGGGTAVAGAGGLAYGASKLLGGGGK